MPQTEIKISAPTELELTIRKTALEAVNAMPTDQLKRVTKLVKSPKAAAYLSSDVKFAILNKFL